MATEGVEFPSSNLFISQHYQKLIEYHILCYLQGTITHGIQLKPCSSFTLHAYSDSDWAGSPDDRKSTSGFCIFFGSNIISWGVLRSNRPFLALARSRNTVPLRLRVPN